MRRRWRAWRICSRTVRWSWAHGSPFEVRDWSQQACRVRIGAREAQAFRGSHSLGDPTQVLPQWLRHATQGGAVLEAGTVVTTGTWCGLLLAQAGDEVVVAFDGLGEARVQL